ncbi:MAG: hypothetical protein Q4B23_02110 [Helcococcus sp.]|nr:hypothetical protein [Helcococcus sp.]
MLNLNNVLTDKKEIEDLLYTLGHNLNLDYKLIKEIFDQKGKTEAIITKEELKQIQNLKQDEKVTVNDKEKIEVKMINLQEFKSNELKIGEEVPVSLYTEDNFENFDKIKKQSVNKRKLKDKFVNMYNNFGIKVEFVEKEYDPDLIMNEDLNFTLKIYDPPHNEGTKIYFMILMYLKKVFMLKDAPLQLASRIIAYSYDIKIDYVTPIMDVKESLIFTMFELCKIVRSYFDKVLEDSFKIDYNVILSKLQSDEPTNKADLMKSFNANIIEKTNDENFNIEDSYNEFLKLGMPQMLDNTDEFNVLQYYKKWARGNRKEFLDNIKNIDNYESKKLFSKIKGYDNERFIKLLKTQAWKIEN